ncbi:MAG: GntR family transcriptional regulator, partial [Rhodobacteraceae bacterium]|nr:GntR family transcriptional regulator [Paracoccaceae bacterium]
MKIAEFLRPENWRSEASGPRYVQLRRRIQEGIDSGLLAPDSPLPPEREIAALTELSRVTVRKAIQELVRKGAVVQHQGSGSFITGSVRRVEQSLSQLTSFSEDMTRRGLSTSSIWLERGIFLPSPEEVLTLSLTADASVARISRLRQADGQAMALERASLPLDILPNPTLVSSSLYEVLDQAGNRPEQARQKISAINLEEKDAKLLNVA